MSADWKLKLIAFLHDPLNKHLSRESQEGRALSTLEQLIGAALFQQCFRTSASELQHKKPRTEWEKSLLEDHEWKRAKRADRIAAAMDRAAFPGDLRFQWVDPQRVDLDKSQIEPVVRHPLSGRKIVWGGLNEESVQAALDAAIKRATEAVPESEMQNRYLYVWRMMDHLLRQSDTGISPGKYWHLLPADNRMVDATLWDHLSMTAALAIALPQAALLIFSVGPVQDFIRTARRTQDLWMGSYILSYLAWSGIRSIAEEFGPDAVVYPSLRGQPLVDHWLKDECKLPIELKPESLARATLPNKFVALLPASKAKSTAESATVKVRGAWIELSHAVERWLHDVAKVSSDCQWQRMFEAHQRQMPEVYWSLHRWPDVNSFIRPKDEADAALDEVQRLLSPPADWEFGRIYDTFCSTAPKMVNVGTVYSQLHELAQRGFEARKNLRDFKPIEERGEKCTMCGMRAALHGQGGSRDRVRQHWRDLSERMRLVAGEYVAIKPEGRERLCGVCLVKRFAQRGFFEDKLGVRGGFPSTSSVATGSFKARVIDKLTEHRLGQALQAHLDSLDSLKRFGFHRFADKTAVSLLPRLSERRASLPAALHNLAMRFLTYDGDAFYEETFTKERLERDYGLKGLRPEDADKGRRTLGGLLEVCRDLDIDPPSKYLAVLMLDGDEMGKWLSGEKAPQFEQALHPDVARRIREHMPAWDSVLDAKRMLSPALHAAMSSALANFALQLVPLVIEQQHCGRVVYAGGDDVLALLPLEEALAAARTLRALFSGEVDAELEPTFRDPKRTGFVELNDDLLLTMGPNATASVGIAVAHHLSPLDAALAAARHAERSAKELYGRNALCIHFLKRSGEEVRVGARWYYENTPLTDDDTVKLFGDILQLFVANKISMKFSSAVFAEARTLAALPREAQETALRRLLKRQCGSAVNSEDERKQQTDKLAPKLAQLAQSLNTHCHATDPAPEDPQPGIVELAKWLALLRRLAQGGGND